MWLMLQQEKPDNYVLATGEVHSVREFVEEAFKVVGINIKWVGKGAEEKGVDEEERVLVDIDQRYFRPTEVDYLVGNAEKAKEELGWEPKTKFKELVKIMVEADLKDV